MVEPPAPMTLADDTINKMTDDVDLDIFDVTPPGALITPEEFDTADFGITTTGINPFEDLPGGGNIVDEFAPPAPPSPPTGTNRPGGDRRDDDPAPSAPSVNEADVEAGFSYRINI
jgi:hypothetical protein